MANTIDAYSQHGHHMSSRALTIAALGIVFGDIGTSPLYAVREIFHGKHAFPLTEANIFASLSLIVWSLILVISCKYLFFVMKADNKGEGGELALTTLITNPRLAERSLYRRALLYVGLFGSALLFGDGIITPAISVLSAVEGIGVATPHLETLVLPLTIVILAGIFLGQRFGSAKIGGFFGPIIFVWFITLGVLGIYGISLNPTVLGAVNPTYAISFFVEYGWTGFFILGAIFLVVTGGEALYADMGHFGRKPIKRAWFWVVFPGLLLNYFGQGALLLSHPEAVENPFYNLVPAFAIYPLVGIATLATIIASQALISGVFSLTRQAVQLGYAPRVRIVHTSSDRIGQIYIPQINLLLFVLTVWLVLEFKTSSELASAYGMAVSSSMVITTVFTCTVAYTRWRWKWWMVTGVLLTYLFIDLAFFFSNLTKFWDGGWFPLTIGAAIFTLMTTWKTGRKILMERLREKSIPFEQYAKYLAQKLPTRVPGTAVFMIGDPVGTPPALLHNIKHNKILHQKTFVLTIVTEEMPFVPEKDRVDIETYPHGLGRVIARYGFMETPNIDSIFRACTLKGVPLTVEETTFFLGRETLIPSSRPGMALWREKLFATMSKNAQRATAFFNIPTEQVVEVGIQVEI